MDTLRLKGLQFFGRHGTETWEKETGCRFEVGLELVHDFAAAIAGDRLRDTLDYREIFGRTRDVVEGESHNLIETVAARIVHEMFTAFPIAQVTVSLAKPEARIGGLNQCVEFTMTRTRAEWEADPSPCASKPQ